MATRLERQTIAKTANYTITPPHDLPGTVFTNAGATAPVIFTLPAPGAALKGAWYRFVGIADFAISVGRGGPAGTCIAKNVLNATDLGLQTPLEIIGGEIEAKLVETTPGTFAWHVSGVAVGHTYTVNV